jgi:hypothetical protein
LNYTFQDELRAQNHTFWDEHQALKYIFPDELCDFLFFSAGQGWMAVGRGN